MLPALHLIERDIKAGQDIVVPAMMGHISTHIKDKPEVGELALQKWQEFASMLIAMTNEYRYATLSFLKSLVPGFPDPPSSIASEVQDNYESMLAAIPLDPDDADKLAKEKTAGKDSGLQVNIVTLDAGDLRKLMSTILKGGK